MPLRTAINDSNRRGDFAMRYLIFVPILTAALLTSVTVLGADDLTFNLSIKDHKFKPPELTIPAGKQVELIVKNLDPTPAEIESDDFNAEKVIPGGGEVTLRVGPLQASMSSRRMKPRGRSL